MQIVILSVLLFSVQCCALSQETIKELDRRLEHFIVNFTSNSTKSSGEAGLPENVYAPHFRTLKKVGIQVKT